MTKYFALGNLEAVAGAVQVPGELQARGVGEIGLQRFRLPSFELPHNSSPETRRCDCCPKDGCIRV